MDKFYEELNDLFKYDPGNRGLPGKMPAADLAGIREELRKSKKVLVVTGFPILPTGIGETDGPTGAVNIARSLGLAGKDCALVTDDATFEILKAAVEAFALSVPIYSVPKDDAGYYCKKLLESFAPGHIIAIERPGKIAGKYRNMRGMIIDEFVSDTDCLFEYFKGVTIAIGDGGNELGMGSLKKYADNPESWADSVCDFPMVAGISNWWGWGLGALISLDLGKNILPTTEEEERLLCACVSAGAIDGVSKKQEATVDGVSLEDNLGFLSKIHNLLNKELKNNGL